MHQNESKKYYDSFFTKKENVQLNERIWYCYKKMIKNGLNASSNILELGCGCGPLTSLLAKKVSSGIIEATDISNYAIDFARLYIKNENVFLNVADAVNYTPKNLVEFDFVTLFDVIEHIPLEKHENLFANISKFMSNKGYLLINIPNPDYIEYENKILADTLQLIDQSVYLDHLSNALMKNNLIVESMETYSVWFKNDYQFFLIKKKTPFREIKLSEQRTFFQKIKAKITNIYISQWHRYP